MPKKKIGAGVRAARAARKVRKRGPRVNGLIMHSIGRGMCIVHAKPEAIRRAMRFYRDSAQYFK